MLKRVYLFFLTYLGAMLYGQSLLLLWFLKNEISFVGILLYFLAMYLFALFFFFILQGRTFSSRFALSFGVATSALGVLVANFLSHPFQIYIISFVFALNIVFFWTYYNILHFRASEEGHGVKSGAYYFMIIALGVVLSPLAGLVADKFGYHFLFLSSAALYIIPFILSFYMPRFDFHFATREVAKKIEHPVLVAFQGYIFMLTYNAVPIFTLFFITTPLRFGNFLGYLAIFGALAALFNAKVSDRLKKRTSFFYFFTSLNALSYLPLFLSRSFGGWQMFSALNSFTFGLNRPFDMAMTMDHAKFEIGETMLGREIYLNVGRVSMVLLLLVIYYLTSSFWTALLVSAVVPLLYPLVAYQQKVYLK